MIGGSRYRQKKSEDPDFERDVEDVIKLESIKTSLTPNPSIKEEKDIEINISPSRNLLRHSSTSNDQVALQTSDSKFKSEHK